jgi:hypothetical protein
MASSEYELRDQVATVIGNAALSLPVLVSAQWSARVSLESLATDRVTIIVTPGTRGVVQADRVGRQLRLTCRVHVFYPNVSDTDFEDMFAFVDELENLFVNQSTLDFLVFEDGESGRDSYDQESYENGVFYTLLEPAFAAYSDNT